MLENTGLTPVQAEILGFLLENGEFKAKDIAKRLNRPRGVVYKGLEDLAELELIVRLDAKNRVSTFRAEHPAKIEDLFDRKERELEQKRRVFSQALPDLVSSYNLSNNKPGIRFFEGNEGIRTVIDDVLKSKEDVYTFIDMDALQSDPELIAINKEHIKKRVKSGTKKKLIAPLSAQKYFETYDVAMTEVRFLKEDFFPFKSGMQIYDGKVSFQTIDKENRIAVILEDRNIYKMHRLFFEYIWNTLEK